MVNVGIGALVGVVALTGLFNMSTRADSQPIGERLREIFTQKRSAEVEDASFMYEGKVVYSRAGSFPGVNLKRNIAYGEHKEEKFDLYTPSTKESVEPLPVIFMVHGGGWHRGDKAMSPVVDNKVKYFLPRGYAFISINYPMDTVNPEDEVQSVGKALAYVQKNATTLGVDPGRIVVMGHSAGAHLVALLTARTDVQTTHGVFPWKGTIPLDGAMYNPVERMAVRHNAIYDEPFGTDPEFWKLVSPVDQYTQAGAPMLFTCSTERQDNPCKQSEDFKEKIEDVGGRAEVLPVDGSHGEANAFVGTPGVYTDAIQAFLTSVGMP